MKSIKTKMIVGFFVLLLLICIGFGVSSYYFASGALTESAGGQLEDMANQGAIVVGKAIDEQWSSLEVLAENDVITDPDSSWEDKIVVYQREIDRSGAVNIAFADVQGNTKSADGQDVSISDRAYFQEAVKGERAVSSPIEDKTNPGSIIIVFAVPVTNDGQIIGVLFKVTDGTILSDIDGPYYLRRSGTGLYDQWGRHNDRKL